MRKQIAVAVTVIIGACLVLASPAVSADEKLNISVVIDDKSLKGKPEAVTGAWVGYAMARANWISEQVKAKSINPKSYSRTFDEEVAGRESLATIWGELKASDAALADAYLDQLEAVKKAGLLREYVWANLRQPTWTTEPATLDLARYADWAKANLAGHVVETHADARIENVGGK